MPGITARPVLQSQRLTLRPPVAADAVRMAELANDFDVTRMTGSMPHPYTVVDAQAFMDRVERGDGDHEPFFAIDGEDGFAGVVGLYPHAGAASELGYWLGRPYWGRGYATEAGRRIMEWVKAEWRRRVIIASHFADNPVSGGVLCKIGFLYTGEIQRHHCKARGEDVPSRMMVWLA